MWSKHPAGQLGALGEQDSPGRGVRLFAQLALRHRQIPIGGTPARATPRRVIVPSVECAPTRTRLATSPYSRFRDFWIFFCDRICARQGIILWSVCRTKMMIPRLSGGCAVVAFRVGCVSLNERPTNVKRTLKKKAQILYPKQPRKGL